MSLFALGDLHLHYQSVLKAPGQLHGRVWKNHEEKFRKYCAKMIQPQDTLVLVGDHSWGKNLSECELDMQYIMELPGRKILTRGNHDMFWDAKKTKALNEQFAGRLEFLQGNYYTYEDYALVGTKGYTFEGPFYLNRRGQIVGWDEDQEEHARKLVKKDHNVSALSADQYFGEGQCVHEDGRGIPRGAGDLRALPRGEPVFRQYYGDLQRCSL